jgi:hypothetical protein
MWEMQARMRSLACGAYCRLGNELSLDLEGTAVPQADGPTRLFALRNLTNAHLQTIEVRDLGELLIHSLKDDNRLRIYRFDPQRNEYKEEQEKRRALNLTQGCSDRRAFDAIERKRPIPMAVRSRQNDCGSAYSSSTIGNALELLLAGSAREPEWRPRCRRLARWQ